MLDARSLIGTHDALFITLDTLRYDVARDALADGRTPNLAALLPGGAWEERHSPGNFTYAAHHAFFAGFLPTPIAPGPHPRLFAARFEGSETTAPKTCVFDAPDIVTGLAQRGYHTVCIGGVGFFNKQNPLGAMLPSLFAESHWSPGLGVTDPGSTENQQWSPENPEGPWMLLAARSRTLIPQLIDLRNSGDTAGDKSRVVGYAAVVFHESARC